ncbi:MAG TPA: S8 family peptidase [Bryobacteraceae bacterium]|jgi:serine protease AprX|nr:S8 family peptidase [Bryobacteraceae bacterium]
MKKTLSIFLVTAFSCWAGAHSKKISGDLAHVSPQSTVRVIVQWHKATAAAAEQSIQNAGGVAVSKFKAVHGGVYTMQGSSLEQLADNPAVKYISLDRPLKTNLDNSAAAVNVAAVWEAGFTGSGIGIAVIDSGINSDPNLGSNKNPVVFSYDFTDPKAAAVAGAALSTLSGPVDVGNLPFKSMTANDQFGHGQHVAGIIAARPQGARCRNCIREFSGMAPGVSLIDLKVLDANGEGTDSNAILAIETAIALKNVYNIRVINLSLGRPVYESYRQDPLCQAVEAAWKAGIVVVVAAGNDGRDNTNGQQGYGTINAPGNDPYVITVGAMKTEGTYTRTDDLVASYSSKGPTQVDHVVKPDLVAPGNLVVSLLAAGSTLPKNYPQNSVYTSYYQDIHDRGAKSNTYFTLSGTSMAAPVVSGAAADLVQANPSLTPDQVKALLMQTAYKSFPQSSAVTDLASGITYTAYYDIFTVGAGYLDVAAALNLVNSVPATGTALSPIANYNPMTGEVTISLDPTSIWVNQSLFGNRSMWGVNSVWDSSVLQGNRCMWGVSTTTSADRSMWGVSTTTSADRAMWGVNSVYSASTTDTAASSNVAITGEQ